MAGIVRTVRVRAPRAIRVLRLRDAARCALGLALGIATVMLVGATPAIAANPAASRSDRSAIAVGAAQAPSCGGTVDAEAPVPRQIDLVIDDSGSMFSDGTHALDRWSEAKYSLEVFAAMLEHDDSLNVYRMSDFGETATAGPRVQLTGGEPISSRVAKIHDMQMVGGGTPYAPVQQAYSDLAASSAPSKWLVILTDGEFDERSTQDVQQDLHSFAAKTESSSLQVAFLGIGAGAATVPDEPARGIHSAHAASSSDLLDLMTGFSNLIFQRNLIKQSSAGHITADIPLEQALVFAQGQNVTIKSAENSGKSIAPSSVANVSWADNQPGLSDGTHVPAVPNKTLQGKIASFQEIPRGDTVFDIDGSQTVDIFYKPRVSFGITLQNAAGQKVAADKVVGGEYTLGYGFMDDHCNFIKSDLLGEIDYSARISDGDGVVADNFAPGDVISLKRGAVVIDASARFLGTDTSRAKIDLHVLEPARPSGFRVHNTRFLVSQLQHYRAPGHAVALTYEIKDGNSYTPFSAKEWATMTPESFQVTSNSNLVFDVMLGDEVGQVYLVPRAPAGDVYAADTGTIKFQVHASHVFDEQLNEATLASTTTVSDDLPWFNRQANWFMQWGWKILLALLALAILLGYVFKRRFAKKVRPRPAIVGTPNHFGGRAETTTGKFTVKTGRKLLPFFADTATLSYVPSGVAGFRPMKLKAGPRKSMIVENWRQIAQRNNVAINGNDLDEETRRAPSFGPSSAITASTPQMTYELTPNV